MDITRLHPELRKAYARIPAVPFHNPAVRAVLSFLMKLMPNKIKPVPGVVIEDKHLDHCSVRIYQPENENSGAGLIWIHGGGYIMGNTGLNDRECSSLAKDLGLLVVSVDYRLAPKYPFPAALDDCFEAWHFMQTMADQWKIDRSRIAILGQSAGGGLAAALVQRIVDAGGIQPAAQILWYPMLDDRTAADTALDSIKHRFWNNRNNRGSWGWYLGQTPGMESAPSYAVPARRENLSGLPPTWLGVGELDLLYNEDCNYAQRLKSAGVHCDLHIAPQAPHAYDVVAPDSSVSKESVDKSYSFLREYLNL